MTSIDVQRWLATAHSPVPLTRVTTGSYIAHARGGHQDAQEQAQEYVRLGADGETVSPVLARALELFPKPVRTLDALHLASTEFLRERDPAIRL